MNTTVTQTLADSHNIYRQTHDKYPEYFTGYSITDFIDEIGHLIKHSNIVTAIDYGCGKARAWNSFNLQGQWKLHKVDLYDPGFTPFSKRPEAPADLVICTDVLEHVPEHLVDEVLADLVFLSKKAIFVNISTRAASKTLVDGSNAHATVKPKHWWQAKLDKLDRLVVAHYTT